MNSRQSRVSRMPQGLPAWEEPEQQSCEVRDRLCKFSLEKKKKIKIKERKFVWDVLLFVKTMRIDGKPSFLQV